LDERPFFALGVPAARGFCCYCLLLYHPPPVYKSLDFEPYLWYCIKNSVSAWIAAGNV